MHTVRCTSRVLEESIFGPFWQNFGHNYGHFGIGIALFWNNEAIMHPKTLVLAKNGNLCDKNLARYDQFKLRVFFYPFFLKKTLNLTIFHTEILTFFDGISFLVFKATSVPNMVLWRHHEIFGPFFAIFYHLPPEYWQPLSAWPRKAVIIGYCF